MAGKDVLEEQVHSNKGAGEERPDGGSGKRKGSRSRTNKGNKSSAKKGSSKSASNAPTSTGDSVRNGSKRVEADSQPAADPGPTDQSSVSAGLPDGEEKSSKSATGKANRGRRPRLQDNATKRGGPRLYVQTAVQEESQDDQRPTKLGVLPSSTASDAVRTGASELSGSQGDVQTSADDNISSGRSGSDISGGASATKRRVPQKTRPTKKASQAKKGRNAIQKKKAQKDTGGFKEMDIDQEEEEPTQLLQAEGEFTQTQQSRGTKRPRDGGRQSYRESVPNKKKAHARKYAFTGMQKTQETQTYKSVSARYQRNAQKAMTNEKKIFMINGRIITL